jgi:hypothetical protein
MTSNKVGISEKKNSSAKSTRNDNQGGTPPLPFTKENFWFNEKKLMAD